MHQSSAGRRFHVVRKVPELAAGNWSITGQRKEPLVFMCGFETTKLGCAQVGLSRNFLILASTASSDIQNFR